MMTHHVLNLGAGVQSTAVALMFDEGLIGSEPMTVPGEIAGEPIIPECAIFADTGEEPDAVYTHLEWLVKQLSYPVAIVSVGKLGDDLVRGRNSTGGRFAAVPFYTMGADAEKAEGMTRRQCTREYKIDPIEQHIRRKILGLEPRKRWPQDQSVIHHIGISVDESRRATRIAARFASSSRPEIARFPLLEWGMSRRSCEAFLKDRVPHTVPRSACVFCPYRSNEEWRRLRDTDPNGWNRAVEVDAALRTTGSVANRDMTQTMYAHRSCVPLAEADIEPEDDNQWQFSFQGECEGMCGM